VSRQLSGHRVFGGLSLALGRGDTLGIVGPNGSGKTTLLRLMVGLLEPTTGLVLLGGLPVSHGLRTVRLAYFGGWATLPPMVTPASWAALFQVHNSLAAPTKVLGKSSPGLRQQAGLRVVLQQAPLDLIVLDEPWDSLDPDASRWLCKRLIEWRKDGASIVVTSHRLRELMEVCTRVSILANGRFHEPAMRLGDHSTADPALACYDALHGA
jgi:ABC-2 type transport system ATP-binding protein